MIPGGAFSFIFSLVAIFVSWVYRGLKKLFVSSYKPNHRSTIFNPLTLAVVSVLVILAVGSVFYGYARLLLQASNKDSNLALIRDALYTCVTPALELGERNVILRLDDVQSYGWTDISIKMMEDAIDKDMFISAGVIPLDITDDNRIVRFLKRENCHIEITMHGYDHGIGQSDGPEERPGEYATLDTEEALRRTRLGLSELSKITKEEVTVFIPPQNQISSAAKNVLASEGFKVISSEGDGYFDYDASTWDFVKNEHIDASHVIADCEKVFSEKKKSVCIIMLHPQDFSNSDGELDERSYGEFEKILKYLQDENIPAIRFMDIREGA